ncbi:MAG: AAA family ATPase [Ruminococcus sp.]|nr:AAA family ATPase [Ruminococcus sp.]
MENNNKPKYLDIAYVVLRDILKNWIAIVCIALSAAIFAYISAALCYVPRFTSRCTMIVSAKVNNTGVYTDTTETEKLTDTIKAVLTSTVLKKKTAEHVGMDSFDGTINVNVIPTTNLLEISVNSPNPHTSFTLLKTLLEIYPEMSTDILGDIVMEIFEEPSFPSSPSNPFKFNRNISLSVLISSIAIILFAALYSYLLDTVKDEYDATEKLDTKLLGITYHETTYKNLKARLLRRKKRLLIGAPSVSFGFNETIKKIRTNIGYYRENHGGKILLVTSYAQGEGKSTIAANLAQASAQRHQKVLLISGSPSTSALLDLFNVTLPEEFLNKKKSVLEDYIYTHKNGKLDILINTYDHMYTTNFSDFITQNEFASFIEEAKDKYDLVVIDGPSAQSSADTEVFARLADFSVLVVKQHCSKTPLLNDTIDTLNKYNNGLAGFIFNNVHSSATVINIGYGYGYGHKIDYGYGRYGKYGRYGSYGRYGKYSKYGKYGNYGNYGRYGAYYQHGRFEAKRNKQ